MNALIRNVFICLLSFGLLGAVDANADYLTKDFRRDVESLKQDYRTSPTTRDNFSKRADIAWAWINAYSLTGKPLPVNITTAFRPEPGVPIGPAVTQGFDLFLEDIIFLDEQPNALGNLSADEGPYEARAWVTVVQRYTVGEKEVARGGGFLIARHFMPGYGEVQVTDQAADNYVSISSNNPNVVFAPAEMSMTGMHGGFRGAQPAEGYRVREGTLKQGDVVTFTYGDTSKGTRGFQMGQASTDFLPMPIYVLFAESDHAYALPIQPIKVHGSDIASVHAFSPSVVRPGEAFELSVRAEDQYYNRATGPIPAFTVYANDKEIAKVPASGEAITVVPALQFESPGVYWITVTSADGAISGVGNPMLVSADAHKVYWGETHGHSGFAEGIGTPDRFMQWAKDDARLDFVTHSEHDIWLDDFEWNKLIANVREYSEQGRFIAYPGYEYTAPNSQGGHHNVLFRDAKSRERVPIQLFPTLSKLYAGLRAKYSTDDVLIIPHAHQSGDYRQNDPEMETLVEIMSQHGTFEWFGRMYLKYGHQVGFVAASDNHLSQPGYTSTWAGFMSQRGGLAAVRAAANTRDGIFDAMKELRTYATTGDRIILDVTVNGTEMGQRAPFAEERLIEGRVIGTAPIDAITIVKNDQEIWHKDYLTMDAGRYQDKEVFLVSFTSPSTPGQPYDNPRGTRGWIGSLKVSGATIDAFEATDFFNPDVNRLERDATDPSVLHFVTGSRGDASSIKLTLSDINRRAKITVDLEPALERGSPTRYRPQMTSAAAKVDLVFRDMVKGETRQVVPVDMFDDAIVLRRVVESGPAAVSFQFKDTGMLQGDYYFVRVKQANDATAWSSPVWVGGFPSQ